MAFIQSVPVVGTTSRSASAGACERTRSAPMMSADNVSRRAVLRLVAGALAVAGGSVGALAQSKKSSDSFDLKELKKDVESLNYVDEVTDVGPDSREKNPTRTKKPTTEPKFRNEEEMLIKSEEAAYDTMVKKEYQDSEKLRDEYQNRKKN